MHGDFVCFGLFVISTVRVFTENGCIDDALFLDTVVSVDDDLDHGRVGQGGDVPQLLSLTGRHLPQYPPHDLARPVTVDYTILARARRYLPSLGESRREEDGVGHGEPGDLPSHQ